jgi:hypothetical protein
MQRAGRSSLVYQGSSVIRLGHEPSLDTATQAVRVVAADIAGSVFVILKILACQDLRMTAVVIDQLPAVLVEPERANAG